MANNGGPILPYICSSAADYTDAGVLNPVPYSQKQTVGTEVMNQLEYDTYGDVASIIENLKLTSEGRKKVEAYNTAKNNLMQSMNFIPVYGNTALKFQILINNSYLTFFMCYNSNAGWTLSIGTSTADLADGIMLVPPFNLLKGLNLNMSIANMFVVDFVDNNSNLVTAWGNGINNNTTTASTFLIYFNDDLLNIYIRVMEDIIQINELHYDFDSLGYIING